MVSQGVQLQACGKGKEITGQRQSCQDRLQQLELHPADEVSETLPCPTVWAMLNASWAEQPWVAPGVQADWVVPTEQGRKPLHTSVQVSVPGIQCEECPGTRDQGLCDHDREFLILEHSGFQQESSLFPWLSMINAQRNS